MRILVEIAYQGNNFLGFQIQQNGRTVQQQFEKLLQRMHKRHVESILQVGLIEVYMRYSNTFISTQS